jgi:GAF domain-containing protein
MRRRSRASSKLANARRRKTVKRRTVSKDVHRPGASAGHEAKVARLTRERDEALERETATSEVLRIISNSPTDLQSALGAIAESAARLLDVADAEITSLEGDGLKLMAKHGSSRQRPVGSVRPLSRGLVIGRAVIDRTTVQVPDLLAAESEFPEGAASARQYGHRTTLATPLLREGNPIGAILIRRMDVRPFTDKQIELLKNFAAQAVIAIENARLLNELRQRTDDLTESLEQQTATSEVLSVISSSAGELEPIFQAMLENAVRICDATFGNIYRWDGNALRLVAAHNTPPALAEARRRSPLTAKDPVIARMLEIKTTIHVDAATHQGNVDRSDPGAVTALELGGVRTVLAVPMLKENELIGSFTVYRQEPRPFTEKQISLVTNFAAQAVIAIENARLLDELKQSLEQQTATSELLGVISRSSGDLGPVFDSVLANAVRICGTLGLTVVTLKVRGAGDIAPAFEALKGRADALYVCSAPLLSTNRIQINSLALGARLPTISGFREYAVSGELMSYGANFPSLFRRAAEYVDKILRGAKPGDLPVEQPTKFEFIINLTTAKALGLTIPAPLMSLADELIE